MSEETNHSTGDKPAVPSNPLLGGWMPIETAPKTNRAILVYNRGCNSQFMVCWEDSEHGPDSPEGVSGASDCSDPLRGSDNRAALAAKRPIPPRYAGRNPRVDGAADEQTKKEKEMSKKEKRTIQNQSCKMDMMIDSENTNQHIWSEVEWRISPAQFRRIQEADDGTPWRTEKGARIKFMVFG